MKKTMTMLLCAIGLGGCVAVPVEPYYGPEPAYYYYGPQPSISFGYTYYGGQRHRHHRH